MHRYLLMICLAIMFSTARAATDRLFFEDFEQPLNNRCQSSLLMAMAD